MDFCFLNLFIGGTTLPFYLGLLQSGGIPVLFDKIKYRQAKKSNIDRNIPLQ